ncbi:hypothetical protein [Novosphingobium sp. MBES04]|uniref:hypothetical protein n=1 Tax=Novosphingobium sp. MBES04 TaxID=1206458 RepID=UPI0007234C2E|nr:hypothetical protein [Novosphingobium sp. MBES04]GAM06346.1 hypothetical protein MBENS4_3343 [Novosphingobium sp. MBES04]
MTARPRPGEDNGRLLGLIATNRITRAQLNERRKAGEFKDIHRGLIEHALQEAGL